MNGILGISALLQEKGIELGLTNARQHIELLNGELEVQSERGRGTVAVARVPMRIGV
jgi:signal transduction histidine kinase